MTRRVTRELFELEIRGVVNELKIAMADGKITRREAVEIVAEVIDAAATILSQAGGRWRPVALFLTLFSAVFTRLAKIVG